MFSHIFFSIATYSAFNPNPQKKSGNSEGIVFSKAGPKLWSDLLLHIRQAPSLSIFKTHLKTHLYSLAFDPEWDSALVLVFCFYCFNIVIVLLFLCYLLCFFLKCFMFYFLVMYNTLSQLWLFKVLYKLSWELSWDNTMMMVYRYGLSKGSSYWKTIWWNTRSSTGQHFLFSVLPEHGGGASTSISLQEWLRVFLHPFIYDCENANTVSGHASVSIMYVCTALYI